MKKEYTITVRGYYPEKCTLNKGKFRGRFDLYIKELDIYYSGILLFDKHNISPAGNKYVKEDGTVIYGHYLRLPNEDDYKCLLSQMKKACRKYMDENK